VRPLLAALLLSCAEPATVASSSAPIFGGEPASDPTTVAIHPRRTACVERTAAACSGVVVEKRLVLTAAHCIEVSAPAAYEVLFGDRADDAAAKRIVVLASKRHPSYDEATHAFDVGLMLLAEDAPVAPVSRATEPPRVDDRVDAVGFGVTTLDGVPVEKRKGSMLVTAVTDNAFETGPSPGMSCHGDSGGPIFRSGQLLGITASGDPGCLKYANNVRLDAVDDFVNAWTLPTPTIGPDRACASTCSLDSECAAGLVCAAGSEGRRCTLPGLPAGGFGDLCTMTCGEGETCARISPDACRCHRPCGGVPPIPSASVSTAPVTRAGGGGCAMGRASPDAWLLTLAALACGVGRRLSTSRRGSRETARRAPGDGDRSA
jgi:hypothetical protein